MLDNVFISSNKKNESETTKVCVMISPVNGASSLSADSRAVESWMNTSLAFCAARHVMGTNVQHRSNLHDSHAVQLFLNQHIKPSSDLQHFPGSVV